MNNNHSRVGIEIVNNIGTIDNVKSLIHCITRLRFTLNDKNKVNIDKLKEIDGVMDVIISGNEYQVVVGTKVKEYFDAIIEKYPQLNNNSDKAENTNESSEKKSLGTKLVEAISGIFVPVLGAMAGAGMIKGILIALSSTGIMSNTSDTYTILYALADAFFYFMPLALAVSAAKRFKANQYVAFAIVAAMIYPSILTAGGQGNVMRLFDLIPIKMMEYTNSVLPPIIVVYLLAQVEKLLNKYIPSIVRIIFVPLLSMIIVFPLALGIIGPVTSVISNVVAEAFSLIYNLNPCIAGGFLGLIWPLSIVFGFHWGFFPIVMNNIGVFGYDTLLPLTVGSNFSAAGAVFGVFLKTKNKKLRQVAGTSAFSAFIGGVTEPAIYGVNLKYKKPFYIQCIFSGIGGVIAGAAFAQYTTIMAVCVVTLPAISTFKGGIAMLIASAVSFCGSAIATYLFGFNDNMIDEK